MVDVGQRPPRASRWCCVSRNSKRILGIDVPAERVREILIALGNVEVWRRPSPFTVAHGGAGIRSALPPALSPGAGMPLSLAVVSAQLTARDLTREIDLIEEVGRIHGYEAIPEDVSVPMVPSARRRETGCWSGFVTSLGPPDSTRP